MKSIVRIAVTAFVLLLFEPVLAPAQASIEKAEASPQRHPFRTQARKSKRKAVTPPAPPASQLPVPAPSIFDEPEPVRSPASQPRPPVPQTQSQTEVPGHEDLPTSSVFDEPHVRGTFPPGDNRQSEHPGFGPLDPAPPLMASLPKCS